MFNVLRIFIVSRGNSTFGNETMHVLKTILWLLLYPLSKCLYCWNLTTKHFSINMTWIFLVFLSFLFAPLADFYFLPKVMHGKFGAIPDQMSPMMKVKTRQTIWFVLQNDKQRWLSLLSGTTVVAVLSISFKKLIAIYIFELKFFCSERGENSFYQWIVCIQYSHTLHHRHNSHFPSSKAHFQTWFLPFVIISNILLLCNFLHSLWCDEKFCELRYGSLPWATCLNYLQWSIIIIFFFLTQVAWQIMKV